MMYTGRFARSVESGWLGKVLGPETVNGQNETPQEIVITAPADRTAREAFDELLEGIAKKHLQLETLKTRNSGVDFQEVAVWRLKDALEAAFLAGAEVGARLGEAPAWGRKQP